MHYVTITTYERHGVLNHGQLMIKQQFYFLMGVSMWPNIIQSRADSASDMASDTLLDIRPGNVLFPDGTKPLYYIDQCWLIINRQATGLDA